MIPFMFLACSNMLDWYASNEFLNLWLQNTGLITVTRSSAPFPVQEDIACNGNEFAIFSDATNVFANTSNEIYFTRVDFEGDQVGSTVQISETNTSASSRPRAVWNGSSYAVAWIDARLGAPQLYFTRVSSDGIKIGADIQVTSCSAGSSLANHRIAWSGSSFGIVWQDSRDGNQEIYFALLDSAGVKQGSDMRVTEDTAVSNFPVIQWDGNGFGIFYSDTRPGVSNIYFSRMKSDGSKDTSTGDVAVTDKSVNTMVSDCAWNGSEYRLAWYQEYSLGLYSVHTSLAKTTGHLTGKTIQFDNASSSATSPSIDWNGFGYALAWRGVRGSNISICFNKFTDEGGISPREYVFPPDSIDDSFPRVCADDNVFCTVWNVSTNAYRIGTLANSTTDPDA